MSSDHVVGAEMIRGIWFPRGEQHLAEMLEKSKIGDIDGRGTYQLHKLRAALEHVAQFRTCVDVGSHVGLWAMHLAPVFDRVEAIEPIPMHRACFAANMAQFDNVTVHGVAAGAGFGTATLEWSPLDTGRTHITGPLAEPGEFETEQILAEIVPIDALNLKNVDFIKIDVEGYELEVVSGAIETIKRDRPVMVVEQKGNDQKTYRRERDEAVKLLHSIGMESARVMAGDHILTWRDA